MAIELGCLNAVIVLKGVIDGSESLLDYGLTTSRL